MKQLQREHSNWFQSVNRFNVLRRPFSSTLTVLHKVKEILSLALVHLYLSPFFQNVHLIGFGESNL